MCSDNQTKHGHFREITIPGDILEDERLSDGAKIMYGKIARLSQKNGFCNASNYFLDGTKSGRNASRFIAELKNAGFILINNEKSKYRNINICKINSRIPAISSDNEPAYIANSGEQTEVENSTTTPVPQKYIKNSDDGTAASKPEVKPPDVEQTVAAASFTPDELKNTMLSVDPTLILSAGFYHKAVSFMSQQGLDIGYVAWLYKQCELKNPNSLDAYYFSIFFLENMAEKYKAVCKSVVSAQSPPSFDIKCPVCGTLHYLYDDCTCCSLPRYASPEKISLFQKLFTFSHEKRAEYLRRENLLFSEFSLNFKNFDELKKMTDALKEEFGLKVECETPS